MDFTISDEQRDLKETARRFARQEMATVAKRIEADDEPLSRDWLGRYAERGFLGINVSATYGGLGLGNLDAVRRLHETHGAVLKPAPLLERLAREGRGFHEG